MLKRNVYFSGVLGTRRTLAVQVNHLKPPSTHHRKVLLRRLTQGAGAERCITRTFKPKDQGQKPWAASLRRPFLSVRLVCARRRSGAEQCKPGVGVQRTRLVRGSCGTATLRRRTFHFQAGAQTLSRSQVCACASLRRDSSSRRPTASWDGAIIHQQTSSSLRSDCDSHIISYVVLSTPMFALGDQVKEKTRNFLQVSTIVWMSL